MSLEGDHLRELRHDFRAVYHVRYDDVDDEEALDLIYTLPAGSLWRKRQFKYGEFTDAEEHTALLMDELRLLRSQMAYGTPGYAQPVQRPRDLEARDAAKRRGKEVRRRLEETEWEEA